MFITPAWAQANGGGGGTMDLIVQFIPLILIFVIFYFLLIRPEQQRRNQLKAMIAAVRKGDIVVTSGGIVGKVKAVQDDEDEVVVEIAKGVDVRVVRATLIDVRAKTEPASGKPGAKAVEDRSPEPKPRRDKDEPAERPADRED